MERLWKMYDQLERGQVKETQDVPAELPGECSHSQRSGRYREQEEASTPPAELS